MKSRIAINIALLAATLCFILLLTLTDREDTDSGIPQQLSSVEPSSITSISIKPRNAAPVSIQRTGSIWRLEQNGGLRANPYRVNAILELLQMPLISSLSPDGQALQVFSLDRPLLELTLNDAVFLFGAVAPLGQGRYVLYNNRINIIADRLYPQLQQGLPFFVSPVLFDGDDPPARIVCNKHAQDNEGPDHEVITDTWQGLQASRVTAMGQGPQNADLTITTRSGQTLHVIAKYSDSELVLSVAEHAMAYHFPATMVSDLGISSMGCIR